MTITPTTPFRRRSLQVAAVLLLLFILVVTGLCAQVPSLPRVDSLIAAGDYEQARADLHRWWSARQEFDVPGSDRARALMLRARLAPDVAAAEPDYLAVILGYPTSEHAPEALLRLGQGLLAANEPVRAAAYLQRLVDDYPGRDQRTQGLLWLARASTAAHRASVACAAAREGLRDADDPDLAAMFRVEEAASCALGSTEADARRAAAEPDPEPERASDPEPARTPAAPAAGPTATAPETTSATGAFAAQTGAFRQPQGARDLSDRLRAAGYEPRTVRVAGSELLRVRVGRVATADQAAALVRRLRAQGFDAYVVGDVRQEAAP